MAKKKTTDQLLAELDALGLDESEEFLKEHPGLREAAYQRDMAVFEAKRQETHGPY